MVLLGLLGFVALGFTIVGAVAGGVIGVVLGIFFNRIYNNNPFINFIYYKIHKFKVDTQAKESKGK